MAMRKKDAKRLRELCSKWKLKVAETENRVAELRNEEVVKSAHCLARIMAYKEVLADLAEAFEKSLGYE